MLFKITSCSYGNYSQGTCLDKVNGFSCTCDAGFSGVLCEVNVDDCRQASCGNGEIFAITFYSRNALI